MKYKFESSNKGTVRIEEIGEYRDGCKDFWVTAEGIDFVVTDTDNAEDVYKQLAKEGVKFTSARSLWYNIHYVQSVMIDRDCDQYDLLKKAESLSDEDPERFFYWNDWAVDDD